MAGQLYEVPFVVGITGHRDLPPAQLPMIRATVESLLRRLREANPQVQLQVLCSMADGADLLVAEVAQALGIEVLALLTFPEDVCRSDLLSDDARAAFDRVMLRAERLLLPLLPGVTHELLQADSAQATEARDRQYQRAALLQARYCSLLIAIWDGRPTAHVAGSARVVEYRRRGLRIASDNDLVFEIRCSRTSNATAVQDASGVRVLGFSGSDVQPADDPLEVPRSLRALLARTATFNADSRAALEPIAAHDWSLMQPGSEAAHPALAVLNQLFLQADLLGSQFRRRFLAAIRLRYTLWAVMAALLFSFERVRYAGPALFIIVSVLAIFVSGRVHAQLAHRRSWHRKYLDYRALAEALRVDYYWEQAGVRSLHTAQFAHDSFLQKQDADLEWIRAALRAVNLRVALAPVAPRANNIEHVISAWIGDDTPAGKRGQLHYYRARSAQLSRAVHRAEHVDRVLLGFGLALALLFLVDIVMSLSGAGLLPEGPRHYLMWCMALLTLYAGIYESYLVARADRTLVRQYRYMHGLFGFASRQLAATPATEARLEVLQSLGQACLTEHAQWTLSQRDKTIQGLKW